MNTKDWREQRFLRLSEEAGCKWYQPTRGHYKHGPVNYYPRTGTYMIDGRKSGRCSPEIAIQLAMRRPTLQAPVTGEEECGPEVIRLADLLGPEVD